MKPSISAVLLFFIVSALALSGCSSSPTPTNQAVPTAASATYPFPNQTGYPGPGLGYPVAQPKVASAGTLIPKDLSPSPQMGMVKGVIKIVPPDPEGVFPSIYLGTINRDKNGNALVTALDRTKAPAAFFDREGHFVIQNIKPGQYTLLVDMVESVFILKESDGKERFLDVQAGKTINVGEIKVNK